MTVSLDTPVTVLISANGSGKSNILRALELVGHTVDGELQRHVMSSGGERGGQHGSQPHADDTVLLSETLFELGEPAGHGGKHGHAGTPGGADPTSPLLNSTDRTESALEQWSHDNRLARAVYTVLTQCRVFHFDSSHIGSSMLGRYSVSDGLSLHSDGSNVAAVLYRLKHHDRDRYLGIVRAVRVTAPFFDDFVLEEEHGHVIVRWRQTGVDSVFPASALGSGTLRFMCLAVLLRQPNLPAVIVLDEPEIGLHPAAIGYLAELMRSVGEDRQVVVATQSPTLLGHFDVEDVVVVNRELGVTSATRLSRQDLEFWLDSYSLPELWDMNVLGGGPTYADVAVRHSF